MSNLDKALIFTLKNEGGFVNNPHDKGGATNWGITIGTAAQYLGRPVSVEEMRIFPRDLAKKIYEKNYWLPLACDKVNHDGMATALFDMGVLFGVSVPPKMSQEILNVYGFKLAVDGHPGPKTVTALNACDPKLFINDFSAKCRNRFLGIVARRPSQVIFLKGWIARANRLKMLAT